MRRTGPNCWRTFARSWCCASGDRVSVAPLDSNLDLRRDSRREGGERAKTAGDEKGRNRMDTGFRSFVPPGQGPRGEAPRAFRRRISVGGAAYRARGELLGRGLELERLREGRRLVRLRTAIDLRGQHAPRHYHDPDDSFVIERQAHCEVTLIRHFASFTPAGDLVRPGNDVALNILELRLRLFHGELLVSARLLEHLPARGDTTKGAARRHGFDIGIEELFRRL
jgi:hypothetical protein